MWILNICQKLVNLYTKPEAYRAPTKQTCFQCRCPCLTSVCFTSPVSWRGTGYCWHNLITPLRATIEQIYICYRVFKFLYSFKLLNTLVNENIWNNEYCCFYYVNFHILYYIPLKNICVVLAIKVISKDCFPYTWFIIDVSFEGRKPIKIIMNPFQLQLSQGAILH